MEWTADALWSKAKMYMDRALSEQRDGPLFPFWCSLALEFLARSCLASIHPTLLAEPDREMQNVLYALGKATPKKGAKSINANVVYALCKQLVGTNFGSDEAAFCESMSNRRNEELHSGGLPFEAFNQGDWLSRYYAVAEVLLKFQGRDLVDLVGKQEVKVATQMIKKAKGELVEKVKKSIAAHTAVFEEKEDSEQKKLKTASHAAAQLATGAGGHRVKCPACGADSYVTGELISPQGARLEKGAIVERSAMLPTKFECLACKLKLTAHAELDVAGIGGQFTRSEYYDPMTYYGQDVEHEDEYNND
jgi:hypothetical protein